jgi:hypothetical protein
MTHDQLVTLERILDVTPVNSAVHGGAIGADAEFDAVMKERGIERLVLPSNLPNQQMSGHGDIELKPQDPLVRNRAIVDACDFLIAAPEGPEVQRSGTWATIRYARKQGKQVTLIRPNGVTSNL